MKSKKIALWLIPKGTNATSILSSLINTYSANVTANGTMDSYHVGLGVTLGDGSHLLTEVYQPKSNQDWHDYCHLHQKENNKKLEALLKNTGVIRVVSPFVRIQENGNVSITV